MPAADAALAVAYSPVLKYRWNNVIIVGMEMQINSNEYDSFPYCINFIDVWIFSLKSNLSTDLEMQLQKSVVDPKDL